MILFKLKLDEICNINNIFGMESLSGITAKFSITKIEMWCLNKLNFVKPSELLLNWWKTQKALQNASNQLHSKR